MSMTNLWVKIVETSGARIYSLIVGMFSLFLTARLLGPEGRGSLAAITSWVALFATVSGLSLGQVSQYRIQVRRQENWLPGILGTLGSVAVITSIAAWAIATLLFHLTNGIFFKGIPGNLLILGFFMLPLMIWDEYSSSLLPATGLLRTYNIAQIAGRTLGLAVLFALVGQLGLGIQGAIAAQIAGQAGIAMIAFYALWVRAGKHLFVETTEIFPLVKGSAKLHLNAIGAFVLGQATILMLNHFATKAEIGWYQLSYQLISVLLVIPQAASVTLFSKMAETGPRDLWPEQKRLGWQLLFAIILMSSVSYFLVPPVIIFFAGDAFAPSGRIFRMLLPVFFGMSFAAFMTNQWIGRGIFIPTTVITFVMAVITMFINYFTIPRFGVDGAVWSMILSFAVISPLIQCGFALYCNKDFRKNAPQAYAKKS
ncbi:MAG: hypothetical protein A2X80_08240 [Geobacteraceae bacterium GWB2_52_12]|nr:MAG: hypothetical protein A2X80_08240 [Geobacteraceae bacterium GWB2_52_12]